MRTPSLLLWKIPVCAPLGLHKEAACQGQAEHQMFGHHLAWKAGKRNVFGKLKLQGACGPEEPDEGVVARETCSSKMSYGPEENKGKAPEAEKAEASPPKERS